MAKPVLYSVTDIFSIPTANRDVNGVYFVRTVDGFRLFRIADTPSKTFVPIDISAVETDPTVPAHVKSITTTDKSNWNSKQNALSGTGFVKSNAGVISYDNRDFLPLMPATGTSSVPFDCDSFANPSGIYAELYWINSPNGVGMSIFVGILKNFKWGYNNGHQELTFSQGGARFYRYAYSGGWGPWVNSSDVFKRSYPPSGIYDCDTAADGIVSGVSWANAPTGYNGSGAAWASLETITQNGGIGIISVQKFEAAIDGSIWQRSVYTGAWTAWERILTSGMPNTSFQANQTKTVAQINDFTLAQGNFKIENGTLISGLGTYYSVLNLGQYSGGGYSQQLIVPFESGTYRGIFLRTSVGTTWGTAFKLWDGNDFTNTDVSHWNSAYNAIAGLVPYTGATSNVNLGSNTITSSATTGFVGTATSANTLKTARTINGTSFDGSANITTSVWGTARTIAFTGDVTGTNSTNGSANMSTALTLANSGVTAGQYNRVNVDAKGRVTAGFDIPETIEVEESLLPRYGQSVDYSDGWNTRGGLATSIVTYAGGASVIAINGTDKTIIVQGGLDITFELPNPAAFPNRELEIVSQVFLDVGDVNANFSGSYLPYEYSRTTPIDLIQKSTFLLNEAREARNTFKLQSNGYDWIVLNY